MTGAGTAVATAAVVNTGLVSAVVGRTVAVGTVSAKTLTSDRCGDAGRARLRERLRVLLCAELGRTVALLTLANKCDAKGLLIGTDEGLTRAPRSTLALEGKEPPDETLLLGLGVGKLARSSAKLMVGRGLALPGSALEVGARHLCGGVLL